MLLGTDLVSLGLDHENLGLLPALMEGMLCETMYFLLVSLFPFVAHVGSDFQERSPKFLSNKSMEYWFVLVFVTVNISLIVR